MVSELELVSKEVGARGEVGYVGYLLLPLTTTVNSGSCQGTPNSTRNNFWIKIRELVSLILHSKGIAVGWGLRRIRLKWGLAG